MTFQESDDRLTRVSALRTSTQGGTHGKWDLGGAHQRSAMCLVRRGARCCAVACSRGVADVVAGSMALVGPGSLGVGPF